MTIRQNSDVCFAINEICKHLKIQDAFAQLEQTNIFSAIQTLLDNLIYIRRQIFLLLKKTQLFFHLDTKFLRVIRVGNQRRYQSCSNLRVELINFYNLFRQKSIPGAALIVKTIVI